MLTFLFAFIYAMCLYTQIFNIHVQILHLLISVTLPMGSDIIARLIIFLKIEFMVVFNMNSMFYISTCFAQIIIHL